MEAHISTAEQVLLTTDGIPLKDSLKKTERRNKIKAFLLVFPLLLFIIVTFVVPIFDMLGRSIDDSQINTVYPKTFEEYKKWDKEADELPPEEVFKAIYFELGENSLRFPVILSSNLAPMLSITSQLYIERFAS